MQKLDGLYVVIPALNEAMTIGTVVSRLSQVADHIIVIDDGSKDLTGEISKSAGAEVIRHESPQGYDASVSDGINHAFSEGAKAVVTCDADGQHRIEDVFKISQPVIQGEVDFCAGIRNRYNREVERVIGYLSVATLGTKDPFCGLKCYGPQIYKNHGAFPKNMFIGTVGLVWVATSDPKLRHRFLPIETPKRIDQPRFGTTIKASAKLLKAFGQAMKAYVALR